MRASPDQAAAGLWQTCIHEAGHACAAVLLGVENIGAVVFDDGGGLATSKPETATMPPASDYEAPKLDDAYRFDDWPALLRDATFIASGTAAVDLILYPERTDTVIDGHDASMLHAAARSALGTVHDVHSELCFADMAAARARTLLKPILWRVKLGAKALQSKRRMTAEEIVSAMYPEFTQEKEIQNEQQTATPLLP